MFNFKISGIVAGSAFALSFLIGLFSGSGLFVPLIRAFIFAVLFFVLSSLIFWLLAQFMPELLNAPEDDDLGLSVSGSRVDISVGSEGITGSFPSDNSENVDDIAGRPSVPAKSASIPLDQEENTGYNADGEVVGELEDADDEIFVRSSSVSKPARAGSADILPDIDSMSESTSEDAVEMADSADIGFDSSEPRRPKSSSRKSEMSGDFDPKELAQAIQTVLKRDDKG